MIHIVWFGRRDEKLGERDASTVEDAFRMLQGDGDRAHAWPAGTAKGLYDWIPGRAHNLDIFRLRMAQLEVENRRKDRGAAK